MWKLKLSFKNLRVEAQEKSYKILLQKSINKY